MKTIFTVLLLWLINVMNGFYIYIGMGSPQCFFSNIYKDERLLIEI